MKSHTDKVNQTGEADSDLPFDAFISYRRSDGSSLAKWLRHRIKSHSLPKQLTVPGSRKKLDAYLDVAYEHATKHFFVNTILPAFASRLEYFGR